MQINAQWKSLEPSYFAGAYAYLVKDGIVVLEMEVIRCFDPTELPFSVSMAILSRDSRLASFRANRSPAVNCVSLAVLRS